MSTSTRQYGRRGLSNTALTTTNNITRPTGVISPPTTTTGSTTIPPRRYVLDVPSGRTLRSSRVIRTSNDDYDDANARSRSAGFVTSYSTGINNENGEQLSRSGSRDYYYREGASDFSTGSVNRYTEDASIKQLIQSGVSYTNTAADDQEVQALTARATPDVKNYPINVDANPELIVRPNTQRVTYTQDIAVRYLKPSSPPPPGPIIIREIRAPAPPPAPPIILRQRPPPPRTPSPLIIRERPPARPKSVPTTIIRKVIPPPPPPPRKLIIERLPNLPPKPRPVIIERWLPYHQQKRQVIHEKAKPFEPTSRIKNTIIEWRPPEVEIVKQVKQLGVQDADPQRYYSQHGDRLYATDFVQRKLTELGLQEELALMQEQQTSVAKEVVALEQADQYSIRQILNGYGPSSSSRQTYTANTSGNGMRLVRSSSHSGIVDEYGERQVLYDRSPNNSSAVVYDPNNYNFDQVSSNAALLTEEILLRSHASNSGKFPTHLLTKLGSQIYDMPSEQVDLSTNNTRRTTTSARYYTVNKGEIDYESGTDEAGRPVSGFNEDKYVQIKSSDLKDVMANYDVYSNNGRKLEGEQITF